jgi:hypothetical protein
MSKYISYQRLLDRWNIIDIEFLDLIIKGLQPCSRYGKQIDCPHDHHQGTILEHELSSIETDLHCLGEQGNSRRKQILLQTNKDPIQIRKELDQKKADKEKQLKVIDNDEKPSTPWRHFIKPKMESEIKEVVSKLNKSFYKLSDVEDFERKFGLRAMSNEENSSRESASPKISQGKTTKKTAIPVISFFKSGQKWMIGEKGKEKFFNNLKGIESIQFLLRYRGEEFNSLEVYYRGNVPLELRHINKPDYHRITDKKKMIEIKEFLEERLTVVDDQEERDKIKQELSELKKYYEGDRNFKQLSDNCRTSNYHNIRRALNTIHKEIPFLKRLLTHPGTIKTGNKISYTMDPSKSVQWFLDPD